MNKLKSIAAGVALGVAASGCATRGETTTTQPMVEVAPTAPIVPLEGWGSFIPSLDGFVDAIDGYVDRYGSETAIDDIVDLFAFQAGYFACNEVTIDIIEQPGGDYSIEYDFPDYYNDLAINAQKKGLHQMIDEYQRASGDSGYQTWHSIFQDMHNGYTDSLYEFCEVDDFMLEPTIS